MRSVSVREESRWVLSGHDNFDKAMMSGWYAQARFGPLPGYNEGPLLERSAGLYFFVCRIEVGMLIPGACSMLLAGGNISRSRSLSCCVEAGSSEIPCAEHPRVFIPCTEELSCCLHRASITIEYTMPNSWDDEQKAVVECRVDLLGPNGWRHRVKFSGEEQCWK